MLNRKNSLKNIKIRNINSSTNSDEVVVANASEQIHGIS